MYLRANELSGFQSHVYLNNLAVCLFELCQYPLAATYYRKAIQVASENGNGLTDVAFYRANYGTLLMYWGKLHEAQAHLLFSYETFCGPCPSNDFAHTLFRLAHTVYWMGYYKDAEKIAESAFREMASCRSTDHPQTAEIRLLYAKILLALNEPLQAEAQTKTALSVLKTKLDPNAPMIGRGYLLLAECECKHPMVSKKTTQYLNQAYRCFRHTYMDSDNADIADYYTQKAEFLIRQARYRKALFNLNKARQIRQQFCVKTHPVFAEYYNRLGFCYAQLKDVRSARKMYIQSLRGFKRIHRHHPKLPELLKNIVELYPARRIAELCTKYSTLIELEKPHLVLETKPQDTVPVDVQSIEPTQKEFLPTIQIVLVATSDMLAFIKKLTRKIQTMIQYYEQGLPKISCKVFVQDNPQASTKSFEEMINADPIDLLSRVFVGLVGQDYGNPARIRSCILKSHPWMIDYRDRSEWELLARHFSIGSVTETIYYTEKVVSKRDIQNPYWKIHSFLHELRQTHTAKDIEVKNIRHRDSQDADFMLFKLNAVVLKAINLFQKNNSVFHEK